MKLQTTRKWKIRCIAYLEDGLQHVHVEGTFVIILLLLSPLLALDVEEVVTPQLQHQLVHIDLELVSVHFSKLLQCEGPSVETGTETNATLRRIDLQKINTNFSFMLNMVASLPEDL